MSFYVLIRNQAPTGSQNQIIQVLNAEGPRIQQVLSRYGIKQIRVTPSSDFRRFCALRTTEIPAGKLEELKTDLREMGYDLKGSFDTYEEARQFYQTGKERPYLF